jgi:hypothetical protein
LRNLPREEQLSKVLDFVDRIDEISQKKTALEFLHLPPQLADENAATLHKILADLKAALTPWSQAQVEEATKAAFAWIIFENELDDLSNTVGAVFVPALNDALNATNDFLAANDKVISSDLKTWFSEAAADAKSFYDALKWVADGLDAITRNQKDFGEWMGKNIRGPLGQMFKPDTSPLPPGVLQPGQHPAIQGAPPPGLYHPASFKILGGQDLREGVSSSASEAIEVIAQGVRKGVFDGLTDFSQSMGGGAGGGGAGGLMNASYEIGGGGRNGPGGGSGGIDLDKIRALDVGIGGSAQQTALARESYNYWRSQGLSREAALASVGNERGENVLGSHTPGDHGTAFGGFQWHMDRVRAILAATGIDVRTASHLDQLRAARWEAENGPGGGHIWAALKAAKDRRTATWLWVHGFERSGNQVGDFGRRLGYSNAYDRLLGPQSLLDSARKSGVLAQPGASKVAGEASLRIKLAAGLAPDGGVKTRGDLFREIHIDRGGVPYADTMA